MTAMRYVAVAVCVVVLGCPAAPDPTGVDAPADTRSEAAVCPGERRFGPYDPDRPLYGDACPVGAGCEPDTDVPGGFGGLCVDEMGSGVCRPICAVYEFPPGVTLRQCCLRGGHEVTLPPPGGCVCAP